MDTRQFHKRCFALLLVCALALGCLPRAQAASRSAIESLQSQQASLTVQKAELQKKLDAVYTQLGDGTIQPMAAAPGADVRKTFASNCLTLHYWILQSVKVSK